MTRKFDEIEARKELLMMRAELERMELGGQIDQVKQEFAWLNMFSNLGALLGGNRGHRSFGSIAQAGSLALKEATRRHPVLGMIASTVLLRFRWRLAKLVLKAGVGAAVLGVGVFLYQKRSRASAHHTGDARLLDHTSTGQGGS